MSSDITAKRYNSILEIIDKRLIPDAAAKAARGEVFTPLNTVREMLFGLRKSAIEKKEIEIWGIDKEGNFFDDDEKDRVGGIPLEVWRNSNTKWLDPANGIGNFPVVAFYMLDYQLGKHGNETKYRGDKNKDARRKHIVENMLYMIELNKGNVNTSRKIFEKIAPGIKANICCANTLTLTDVKLKSIFNGINRFNIVMGNPPFNENLENNPIGHAQDTGLWENFVKKSFELFLNKEEFNFLVFLHPARWRQPNHDLHNLMFEKQFHFLAIYNKKEGLKRFNAVTRFDYYIIENIKSTKDTIIKFEDNNIATIPININIPFISNFGFDIWKILIDKKIENIKVLGGGSKIKYSTHDHANNGICNKQKPFLNVNTTAKTSRVPKGAKYLKTIKKSNSMNIYVDFVCSSNEHESRKVKKVIFSKNEVVYPFYDNGEYGLTSNAFFIKVENKEYGNKIIQFLNSKLIKYLIASVKFGNYSTSKNIFEYIPNPLLFIKGDYSENNILDSLGLNKKQKENILNQRLEDNEEDKSNKKGGAPTSRFTQTRKNRKQ